MEVPPRAFWFDGNDAEYQQHLELQLMEARECIKLLQQIVATHNLSSCHCTASQSTRSRAPEPALRPSFDFPRVSVQDIPSNSHQQLAEPAPSQEGAIPISHLVPALSRGLEIVHYNPRRKPTTATAPQNDSRSDREFNEFLSAIPATKDWKNIQPISPEELKFLLSETIKLDDSDRLMLNDSPTAISFDLRLWDKRSYQYVVYTSQAIKTHSAIGSILQFRIIISVLMFNVMLETGVSVNLVNAMMRNLIANCTAQGLQRYRSAAKKVNRCILNLSNKGWGNRSAEIFYRFGRTLPQYRHMFTTRKSCDRFLTEMEKRGTPHPLQDDQMPISIPCIIKRLAGESIKLQTISCFLGYDIDTTNKIYQRFYNQKHVIIPYPSPPQGTSDGNDAETGDQYPVPNDPYSSSPNNEPLSGTSGDRPITLPGSSSSSQCDNIGKPNEGETVRILPDIEGWKTLGDISAGARSPDHDQETNCRQICAQPTYINQRLQTLADAASRDSGLPENEEPAVPSKDSIEPLPNRRNHTKRPFTEHNIPENPKRIRQLGESMLYSHDNERQGLDEHQTEIGAGPAADRTGGVMLGPLTTESSLPSDFVGGLEPPGTVHLQELDKGYPTDPERAKKVAGFSEYMKHMNAGSTEGPYDPVFFQHEDSNSPIELYDSGDPAQSPFISSDLYGSPPTELYPNGDLIHQGFDIM
ncbi:hypothetical protein LOZ65_006852 [Ophidiomyces ophidiicola]|nr:hypothetical protein LOZ65_006852 [Ophidiomyces ophidiicola]